MTTLTVHRANSNEETVIRLFLDALHVEYRLAEETDETAYLMSSAAMAEQINTAIAQEEREEGKKVTLDDIWK